ncbi:MAG: sulfatase [Planctomycetaceae bacterium]
MRHVVAIALLALSATVFGQEQNRNVVVVVADDLGFQLGCYGDGVARTPNIDRLAKDGTRFTLAHCTTASCSASRSVILTGLYNHATGHYGHSHDTGHFSTYESVPTLPVLLAEAGYRTCSIGKYHVAPDYVYKFEDYRNQGIQGARNSVRMAANAKEWIAEDDDRPFFLYWCPSDPHRGGGPDHFSNFPDELDKYHGIEPATFDPQAVPVPSWLPDMPTVRQELAAYYRAIHRMDQGVGDLLDALEATGHADDTLVLFLSDNGPPFPGAKTTLYQPGMNLPLIVRDPSAAKKGVVSDARVCWADLAPSILDWCGVEPKPHPAIRRTENDGKIDEGPKRPVKFHGKSFVPAIGPKHVDGFEMLFASHNFHEITNYYPMRVLIEGDHKLIFNIAHPLPYPFASDLYASPTWQDVLKSNRGYYGKRRTEDYLQRPRFELYDLKTDPDEVDNLADDPAHRSRLERMQATLKAWQEETNDPWATKWTYE